MGCRTLPITLPRVAGIARTAGLTMRVRSFDCDIDVMDLICLEDVMEEFGLGPNGGMCCPTPSGVPAVPAVTSPPTCAQASCTVWSSWRRIWIGSSSSSLHTQVRDAWRSVWCYDAQKLTRAWVPQTRTSCSIAPARWSCTRTTSR